MPILAAHAHYRIVHPLHIVGEVAPHRVRKGGIVRLGGFEHEEILRNVRPIGAVEPEIGVHIHLHADILFDEVAARHVVGVRFLYVYLVFFYVYAFNEGINAVIDPVEIHIDEFAFGNVVDPLKPLPDLVGDVIAHERSIVIAWDDSVFLRLGYAEERSLAVELYRIGLLGVGPGAVAPALDLAGAFVIAAGELLGALNEGELRSHPSLLAYILKIRFRVYVELRKLRNGGVDMHARPFGKGHAVTLPCGIGVKIDSAALICHGRVGIVGEEPRIPGAGEPALVIAHRKGERFRLVEYYAVPALVSEYAHGALLRGGEGHAFGKARAELKGGAAGSFGKRGMRRGSNEQKQRRKSGGKKSAKLFHVSVPRLLIKAFLSSEFRQQGTER